MHVKGKERDQRLFLIACTIDIIYCMAGNFHGLYTIFVIFMLDLAVTKISTHNVIFSHIIYDLAHGILFKILGKCCSV